MLFLMIGQWLIDGESPHTGEPVNQTRRMVKSGDSPWKLGRTNPMHPLILCKVTLDGGRTRYEVDKTYAIQLGRGMKAIGRTPPLKAIWQEDDVRDISYANARASGYKCAVHYLFEAWCPMHDPLMVTEFEGYDFNFGIEDAAESYLQNEAFWLAVMERPAKKYGPVWTLVFDHD
jgi:hypothetical protein